MIHLKKDLTLRVKKSVKIINKSYNMPSNGKLNPNTIIKISGGPTRLSDVPFKVIAGGGTINLISLDYRGSEQQVPKKIIPGDSYFFNQGHTTVAPYDFGSLSTEYFEVLNDY